MRDESKLRKAGAIVGRVSVLSCPGKGRMLGVEMGGILFDYIKGDGHSGRRFLKRWAEASQVISLMLAVASLTAVTVCKYDQDNAAP
ncbi:Hypothetical protein NocV09_01000580 [Nannochloropsis oceanica]